MGPLDEPVATFAVLGDPVDHSLSPRIHGAAFRAAGRRARYVARRVSARDCGPTLRSLALAGGGGNVTVPHKERALRFLERRTAAVDGTGACNTFWAEDGQVCGDNTDVEGFQSTWDASIAGGPPTRLPPPDSILVLGAGGAARAVLFALLKSSGASEIALWNRTAARAESLAEWFADDRIAVVDRRTGLEPDVVVNATSVGLGGKGSPIRLSALSNRPRQVLDLVYGATTPPLGLEAEGLEIPYVDGREMLVRQAEAAYRRWFGESPPRGVMARALE